MSTAIIRLGAQDAVLGLNGWQGGWKGIGMRKRVYYFNDAILEERYEERQSIRGLASAYGCSYGTIWRNLKRIGARMRPPGGVSKDGRWSLKWTKCRAHGATDKRYYGRGLCIMCYKRWQRAERPRFWQGLMMIEGLHD